MTAPMGGIQGDVRCSVEAQAGEPRVELGPGAPTLYLPWLRRYWSLWLASDARNDAWIR